MTFPPNPFFQEQPQMLKMTHRSHSVIQAPNLNCLLRSSSCFFPHPTSYQILLLLDPKCMLNQVSLCHCPGPGLCYFPSGSWRSLLIGLQFIFHILATEELAKTKISSCDPQLQLPHITAYKRKPKLLSRYYKAFVAGLTLNLHAFFLQGSSRCQLCGMVRRGLNPASSHVFAHAHLACPLDHQNVSSHPQVWSSSL